MYDIVVLNRLNIRSWKYSYFAITFSQPPAVLLLVMNINDVTISDIQLVIHVGCIIIHHLTLAHHCQLLLLLIIYFLYFIILAVARFIVIIPAASFVVVVTVKVVKITVWPWTAFHGCVRIIRFCHIIKIMS